MDAMKLRATRLLKCLDEDQWQIFQALIKSHKKTYTKGQMIYLEGDDCRTMDFIITGGLQVKRHDEEGRTLMVERFSQGDFLGANLLFSSTPQYPMSIISETDSVLVAIDKKRLLSWCQTNSAFLEAYLKEISDKSAVLVRTINKLSTGTLRDKLMGDFKRQMNPKGIVTLKASKKEMSERYGVARTSLSRELNRMIEDGLLEKLSKDQYRLI